MVRTNPHHIMTPKRFRSPYHRLLALWILRAFSSGSATTGLVKEKDYADDEIAEFLGLPSEPEQGQARAIRKLMGDLKASLEKTVVSLPARVRSNFSELGKSLNLDPTELQILEFFVCLKLEPLLSNAWFHRTTRKCRTDSSLDVCHILGISKGQASNALAKNGRLVRCGLLRFEMMQRGIITLCFHSNEMAKHLFEEKYNPAKILKHFGVIKPPASELGISDYRHLQVTLDLMIPYLKQARSTRKAGVNVLIYGAPGTGKTQLIRVIGAALGTPVYELDTADGDGEPLKIPSRLERLNLAQTYFSGEPVLLVFDEAEDILTPSFSDRGFVNTHKGWFNQMLENNHQPVCWISNSIEALDPAFARRFDFILEVPIPPEAQRNRILREQVGKLVSPQVIDQLAGIGNLAPAVVSRARDVIQSIRRDVPKGDRDSAFTHVIGGILKAQGHRRPIIACQQIIAPGVYDIDHLNTTSDLRQMADMIKRNPSARLCLHGPPGTGKTAFGHWLASEIERPLQVERGSDLLSPFMGMTEKAIARTFEKAVRDEAVLMIDEVDSFLQDRGKARHSWEVTQINEMLTQIESFPGVLIASTNFPNHLDAASLRRFDLKLGFGYLKPEQIRRLLISWSRSLALCPPDADDLAMVEKLDTATPGDFAAVARQHKFQPFSNARALLQAVIAESEIKIARSRQIGFQ